MLYNNLSKRIITFLLLTSLVTASLASCSDGADEPLPLDTDTSAASDTAEPDTVAISSDDVTTTEVPDTQAEVTSETTANTTAETTVQTTTEPPKPVTAPGAPDGAGRVPATTTAKRTTYTDPPKTAKPSGGAGVYTPPAAVSPKITTTDDKNDKPEPISTQGFAAAGETITLEGYVPTAATSQSAPPPTYDNTVEVNPTTPLLDSVECIVNELELDAVAAEAVNVITSPDMLAAVGLDPAMYSESFFANYCLMIADTAAIGKVASSRVISLDESNGGLTMNVRFERSSKSGTSYRRYIIETAKKYAEFPLTVKKQYAELNNAMSASKPVDTRIAFEYTLNYPAIGMDMTNTYVIPALTYNTAAARALNEDIERTVYTECGELIKGYADGLPGVTSNVNANWGQNPANKLIWITLNINNTGTLALGSSKVYGFYYDPTNARRLTAAEYLAANGLSTAKVVSDLASGYGVAIDASAVNTVRVYGADSYIYTFWDGSRSHDYMLPVNDAGAGVKYIHNMSEDGKFAGITVIKPDGKSMAIGNYPSTTAPAITVDSTGLLLCQSYISGGFGSFMVIGLENGRILYDCRPDIAKLSAWYGLPSDSAIVLTPTSIKGTSSHFNVMINVAAAHGASSASGVVYYDSLTGTLSHLTSDGLSLNGPWTHTPGAGSVNLTNGTVTRSAPCDTSKPYSVQFSGDWHYAAISQETGSFTIDETREGQPTLSVKYSTHTVSAVDLATGNVLNMPQYTAAGLLAEKNIADIGYTNMAVEFAGWTSNNSFNVRYTLLTADGVSAITLTAACRITAGVLSVVSIS